MSWSATTTPMARTYAKAPERLRTFMPGASRPTRPPPRRRAATDPDSGGRRRPRAGSARTSRTWRRRPEGFDRHPGHLGQAEGVRRPLAGAQPGLAGAEHLGRVETIESREQLGIGDVNHRRRFQRPAHALFAPLDLQRAGDHPGDALDLGPALGLGVVAPGVRRLREHPQAVGAGVGKARRSRPPPW